PLRVSDVRNGHIGGVARVIALAVVLNLVSGPTQAQSGNQGSIEGVVTDSSGAVLAGVAVGVRNLETAATVGAPTNDIGLFRFPILPLGSYELTAEHPGFAKLT